MADVDHLFDLPLDRFVAARDALARELKRAGDSDAAAEVKALRKPSVSAWAVNQAVRQHPELADELIDAAAALREAQRQAVRGERAAKPRDAQGQTVAGDEATDLREATKRHRAAVAELAKAATAFAGGSGAVTDRITSTVRATAASEAAAEAVRAAMLTGDLDPSGFGDVSGLEAVSAPAERQRGASSTATKTRRVPGARSHSTEATAAVELAPKSTGAATKKTAAGRDEQKERRAAADEARAAELEEEAERAETEAALAEAEHARLEEMATDAEAVAKAARTEASEARRAAAEARTAADGAKRRAAKAREKADRR